MRALVTRLLSTVVASLALIGALGVVGVASASAGECPNEQVRSESAVNPSTGEAYSLGLPQCRAYEMASPQDKEGHDAWLFSTQMTFAAEGSIVYTSEGEFANPEGGTAFLIDNPYRAARDGAGWLNTNEFLPTTVAPQALGLELEAGLPFAPDLSKGATCGNVGEGSSITEPALVCAIHEPDGSWIASPRFPDTPNTAGGENSNLAGIYGASTDLSHIFFILSTGRLLESDTEKTGLRGNLCQGSGIYEIAGLGTHEPVRLRLVNVDNNGVEIGTTMPQLGNSCGGQANGWSGTAFHAISEDGSTVYFEAKPVGGVQQLYARLGASHTVSISEPSAADCSECQTTTQNDAQFQGASADGTKVFFTTEQELLPGKRGTNLYEYESEAPAGHKISAVTAGSTKAEVQGVLRNSGNGSHIYFVAKSVLTGQANANGQEAQLGADNMYMYERDSAYPSGRTAFVALLCSGENLSGAVPDSQCSNANSSEKGNDAHLWGEVDGNSVKEHNEGITRDGNYIVFATNAHLSPEDNNAGQAIYRYDALTGEVTWVSHPAPGFATWAKEGLGAHIPSRNGGDVGADPAVEDAARVISENGEDIIFTTGEALQADDVNAAGTKGASAEERAFESNDVYLWHDGTVSMVSDGHAHNISTTPAMSASGSDIFFATRLSLVGQDIDENQDIYDARVDGGYPAPVMPPTECGLVKEGEACQGGLSTLPLFGSPGSVSFTGGANVTTVVSGGKAPATKPKSKPLTNAQKLTRALRACRKQSKKKRAVCEAKARKKYGAKSKLKSKKSSRRGN